MNTKSFALFAAAVVMLVFLAAFLVPLPLAHNLDFFPVYGQVLGFFNGIGFYREEELYKWLTERFALPAGAEVPPLAQPPWYYLSLSFLALFDVAAAAKVWFALCTLMLIAAVYLLTGGWNPRARGAAVALAFLFPPAVGHLIVGQFAFPVLLGAALMVWGAKHENDWAAAAGLALATFKPHLGAPVIFTALLYFFARSPRAASIFKRFAICLLIFIGASFLADPGWITRYPEALTRVGVRPSNVGCDTCISFTYALSAHLEWENAKRWRVGAELLVFALACLAIVVFRRRSLNFMALIGAAGLCGLLFSPYVRNYDAVLALPAFIAAAGDSRLLARASALGCYAAAFFMLYGQLRGAYDNLYWIPLGILFFTALVCVKRATRGSHPGP